MTRHIDEMASFVHSLTLDAAPAAVREECKRQVLDAVATVVAAQTVTAGRAIAGAVTSLHDGGAGGTATVVGGPRLVSADQAAFANAQMSIMLDLSSNFMFSQGVPGVTIFPALAIAEQRALTGRALLEALVAGYEIAGRVGMSLPPPYHRSDDGTRVVPTANPPKNRWAIFGGAAAAAKILGLAPEEIRHALALSAAAVPILPRKDTSAPHEATTAAYSSMAKYGLFGGMASTAVLASLLAQRGFTGDELLLEAPGGFQDRLGSGLYNPSALTHRLGSEWLLPEANYKLYPAGTHNQHALRAIEALLAEQGIDAGAIEEVTVGRAVGVSRLFTNPRPANYVEAQFSLPFQVAAVAMGAARRDWPELVGQPAVEELAARVHLRYDPDAARTFLAADDRQIRNAWWPRNRIVLVAGGVTHDWWAEYGPIATAQLVEKFRHYAHGVLAESQIDGAVELILGLEELADLRELTRLLRPA